MTQEEKKLPDGLAEAAEEYAYQGIPDIMKSVFKPLADDTAKHFIAGAKWDRAKMMEKAVDTEVVAGKDGDKWLVTYVGDYESMLKVCKTDDKIKIIVIPE